MKHIILSLFATAVALHAESPPLGKAGDLEIKTDEIRETIAGLEAAQGSSLAKDTAALAQYVRALLIQRLVLQKAVESKWDQDPAVVAKLVRARESALTESYLESVSRVPAGYPSDAEVQSAYEAAKASLIVPKSYRLAQIFIALPKDADQARTEKVKAKADVLQKKLKEKGADFATIAASDSEETASKSRGGEIGWLAESQIQPEIRERLPRLTIGAVTEAVKLADGWHILKVLEVKDAHTAPLEQVKDQLVIRLRTERAQRNRQEYLATLLKEHPLAINEIELGKLLEQRKQ